MKEICIIADGYPYKKNNHCVFVRELIAQFAKDGIKCSVIAPIMMLPGKKREVPYHYKDIVDENFEINVFRPRFLHITSKPFLMGISSALHAKAVCRVIKKENLHPEIMYGHFIYHNGLSAMVAAKKYKSKAFIACGENSHRLEKESNPYSTGLKWHNWRGKLKEACGIICVSSANKELLESTGFIDDKMKTCVIPNAVDTKTFCCLDKEKAKKKLEIPEEKFTVIFVGSFCDRKGNIRVDEALCGEKDVQTVFIGKGEEFIPKSNCLFCGTVKHSELPLYLNAADAFVLPTTGEGCCNAIVEAIACGLPVISSENSFNDDILDDGYSIRINPMNVEEIRKAVLKLKNDPALCENMRRKALKESEKFSMEERAKRILDFMENN